MHWKISTAKGSGTDYIGEADDAPLQEVVQELWRKYLEDVAPKNTEVAWDHLRIELWLDSGRIILFPARIPFRARIEKSSCQIGCPVLNNFFDTLLEANLPDADLDQQLNRKEQEITMLISASAKEMELPQRLGRSEIKVLYYGADLQTPIKSDNFI